ncbi:carbohydrate esterase family 16 protein [Plicaturopsis crispa FD-325 SS-3]|nr:carbohydrate esterase family 16 protein [Plicaturopsis crispa FD-325 SS-3]
MSLLRAICFASSLFLCVRIATAVGVKPNQIKDLVTFGDSYTDAVNTADGGQAWPTYAAGYGNFTLHPFARSGATCSNNLTYRPFPSLYESQLPLYFAEKANGTFRVDEDKTIYTLWIGTNDVGVNSLLVGQGKAGVTVVDTSSCAVSWVKTIYDSGGRNFLFQNMIPLEHTILYSNESYFNVYWSDPRNSTAWSVSMRELTQTGNAIAKLLLQALAPTLPGAHIGLFNSNGLFQDMIDHPANYLNGTAPLNVTGAVKSCVYPEHGTSGVCTTATGTDRDSFLWYDELHPSEQSDRIVAREITKAIQGKDSKWTTWFS